MNSVSKLALALLAASSLPAHSRDWKPVTTELLAAEKTGYGGLCGVVVDHKTGDLFVNLSDLGMFQSADQGETWSRATASPLKGRTESPGCWIIDPTAKSDTMIAALVYGAPISVSTDRAKTFTHLHGNSEHVDWCATDWTSPDPKFVLALKHEQNGLLIASTDAGKSFQDIATGFISGWVFDATTAVVAKEGNPATLQRTTDAGKTFTATGEFTPVGRHSSRTLPKWHGDKLYWLTTDGLIATSDQGATWQTISKPEAPLYGPVFGKTADHLILLANDGIIESTDAGKTWSDPLPTPKELGNLEGLTWLDYAPNTDTFYIMKMTSQLYRLQRGR